MNLPARFIRGQALTADQLNAIVEAIRRARPLPGTGVSTRESPDGTFISAAAQKQSPVTPFDHRFKVSFAKNKDGGYNLTIRKGSLWRVTDGVATEQPLTLGEAIAQHPTDADAWQVAAATTGSLYVSQSTAEDGKTPVFTLDYSATPTAPAAVIADFTPSESSSNPTPKLTQRHLGDLILFEGGGTGGEVPAAWMVRRHAFTETNTSGETVTTHKWQVFSPLWCGGLSAPLRRSLQTNRAPTPRRSKHKDAPTALPREGRKSHFLCILGQIAPLDADLRQQLKHGKRLARRLFPREKQPVRRV